MNIILDTSCNIPNKVTLKMKASTESKIIFITRLYFSKDLKNAFMPI